MINSNKSIEVFWGLLWKVFGSFVLHSNMLFILIRHIFVHPPVSRSLREGVWFDLTQKTKIQRVILSFSFYITTTPTTFTAWHKTRLKAALLPLRQPEHTFTLTHTIYQTLAPTVSQFRQRSLCVPTLYRTSTNPNQTKHQLAHRHSLSVLFFICNG